MGKVELSHLNGHKPDDLPSVKQPQRIEASMPGEPVRLYTPSPETHEITDLQPPTETISVAETQAQDTSQQTVDRRTLLRQGIPIVLGYAPAVIGAGMSLEESDKRKVSTRSKVGLGMMAAGATAGILLDKFLNRSEPPSDM